MNQIVPRATITQIDSYRRLALKTYLEAHDLLMASNSKMKEAGALLQLAAPTANGNIFSADERKKLFGGFDVAPREEFYSMARHMVDADIWSHVVQTTELERLMDKKAKDELRQQLLTNPVEFTEETALATLEAFAANAGMIFRRGIAEVFTKLDRRFRSHNGFKIGSRIIVDHAFDEYGHWNYHRSHRDTLQDIERVFLLLDGQKPKDMYAGIVGEIDQARSLGSKRRRVDLDSKFYKVRMFENGNIHLWFKRADLVTEVNKLLAEYYGEVIPDGAAPEDDGGLHEPKRSLAKNYGFFPTPAAALTRLFDKASLYRHAGDPQLTVLEPSAGTGNLAFQAHKEGAIVDCVEIQTDMAMSLRLSGAFRRVHNVDFLDLDPASTGLYDRVIMNPPFDRERDIDHVMHALKFLKSDGLLVAIMSAHTEFAESRKAVAFREHIASLKGHFSDLPAGSFSSVGTNVNTLILKVRKDGKDCSW